MNVRLLLLFFVFTANSSLLAEPTRLQVFRSDAVRDEYGQWVIRLTLLFENTGGSELEVPTKRMGPNVLEKDGPVRVFFSHVPRSLKNGRYAVEPKSTFEPVVLGEGDATIIEYDVTLLSNKHDEIVVIFDISEWQQKAYGFYRCRIEAIAKKGSPFLYGSSRPSQGNTERLRAAESKRSD